MLPGLALDNITIDEISAYFNYKSEVHVLRLDKISPVISGNKWFKLRYYIEEAKTLHKHGIRTFGGAWSNHILATAAACASAGLQSIGIIRGGQPTQLSSTLKQALAYGTRLEFISRSDYRDKRIAVKADDNFLTVNEGGYGPNGAKGAATILDYCDTDYTHYCCAVGTGTMLSGIINRLQPSQQAIGISVLKNNFALEDTVQQLTGSSIINNWQIIHDYAWGGYAKYDPTLLAFMNDFYRQTNIPSDFVYTGKLFYAVTDLLKKNYFPGGSKILVIHSGGLQGNTSIPAGTLMF